MTNYPFLSYSWILPSAGIAIKHVDISLLKDKKTGIPKAISNFFPISTLSEGGSLDIKCKFQEKDCTLRLELKCNRYRISRIPLPLFLSPSSCMIFSYNNQNQLCLAFGDGIDDKDLILGTKPTSQEKTINVRIRQAEFRQKVIELCEGKCCVTGVRDVSVLIASHIQSWADSDDLERVDEHNGLLLAPHIDKLFDRYLITFGEHGELIVSRRLQPSVLKDWGIDGTKRIALTEQQNKYMAKHRNKMKALEHKFDEIDL